MPSPNIILDLADFFDAFSDPTRIRILTSLRGARLCVCDIAAILAMSVSAVSHQLRLLRALRLVRYTCEGRMVFYELDDRHVSKILEVGLSHIAEK
jgi:ArsR family transcriptional regulator